MAVGEDAVKVGPGPLDRHPGGDYQVCHHQLPLPSTHLCLEILDVLTHQNVLQLNLSRRKHEDLLDCLEEACFMHFNTNEMNQNVA